MTVHLGSYEAVLHGSYDLVFTSPPYNIGSKGPRDDKGRRGGGYAAKSFGAITDYPDSLPEDVYQDQQAAFLVWCAAHLAPGGTLVYNHKPRMRGKAAIDPHRWFLRPEVEAVLTQVTEITWDRGSTHNTGPYQVWQQTERLYVFRRACDTGAAWRMDNHRSRHGLDAQFQSDCWHIPLTAANGGHNAPFPLKLAETVVRLFSEPGQLVADPYAGSGTTGVAALSLGRRFEGAEVLGKYHALAELRISAVEASEEAA